jgi:sentrin-specific protease 8
MMDNPDEVNAIFCQPLNFANKSYIVFAVNDQTSIESAGGTHWSMCVYSRNECSLFHFDSSSNANYRASLKIFKILKACLNLSNEFKLKQMECLQQNNSYDCGIYVLCHADIVYKTILKSKAVCDVKKIHFKSVSIKRAEIIEMMKNAGANNLT